MTMANSSVNINKLKLLIIEDEIDLLGIYQTFASEVFDEIITADSYDAAKSLLENHQVDCMMVDNMLPGGEGINLVKDYGAREKNIPVVMITANPYMGMAIDSVNFGVHYFLEKPATKEAIVGVLNKCKDYILKQRQTSDWSKRFMLREHVEKILLNQYKISKRELELIGLCLTIQDNQSISEMVGISKDTVRKHFEHIFRKLDISSKKELKKIIYDLNEKSN